LAAVSVYKSQTAAAPYPRLSPFAVLRDPEDTLAAFCSLYLDDRIDKRISVLNIS